MTVSYSQVSIDLLISLDTKFKLVLKNLIRGLCKALVLIKTVT